MNLKIVCLCGGKPFLKNHQWTHNQSKRHKIHIGTYEVKLKEPKLIEDYKCISCGANFINKKWNIIQHERTLKHLSSILN